MTNTLLEHLKVLVEKEKKSKEFKNRLRVKGVLVEKKTTKKGNIVLIIEKDKEQHKFTVLKSHKERFFLAEKSCIKQSVYASGIPKLRMIICTQLKILERGIDSGRQRKLQETVI